MRAFPFLVVVIVSAVCSQTVHGQCGPEHVAVKITYSHVEDESMEGCPHGVNDPDPYLRLLLWPQLGCHRQIRTPTESGEGECNHPFENTLWEFCNVKTLVSGQYRTLNWKVMDEDRNADDYMTSGSTSLVYDPSRASYQHSRSNHHYISLRTRNPSPICFFGLSRVLPATAGTSEVIAVVLNLTPAFAGDVSLFEQIPRGFTFLGATPSPDSVETIVGDNDEDGSSETFGTLLRWDISNPTGGTPHLIQYDVQTSSVPEDVGRAFASKIIQGPDLYYTAFPLEELAIGGVLDDCNNNSIDDTEEIELGAVADCNENLKPDECEILDGTSNDCNFNGVPDGCDIANGDLHDFDHDGEADDCPTVSETGQAAAHKRSRLTVWPNPFNPNTAILFELPNAGHALLEVFDVKGKLVATLANRDFIAGRHRIVWNGTADEGKTLGSGIYFLSLTAEGRRDKFKLVLVR